MAVDLKLKTLILNKLLNNSKKKSIMEKWLMIIACVIYDTWLASSFEQAKTKFIVRSRYEDYAESDIMSEADWTNELELNKLESQSS